MNKELIFITTNKHKVKEIRALANSESKDITIAHLDYDYPKFQLDEIETVAEERVNYIGRYKQIKVEKPFFIEDSGLTIPTLNGFPGPFSAFVFNKIGNAGF
uniref:DITP/XTP pyrophosphatase n=1 Tax=Candidatus Methanophaga sp. ANME-1 ERB7 TaxID=2759913 RepID=A0A7G9Z4X4_9EURY|nr:dITP/XTP pyrophosphatase [Methanosarcinales archaeon ANME-1 ERB7]